MVPLLVFGCAACGPIYIHDPAGETAAKSAMQGFQTAIERGQLAGVVASYKAQQATTIETIRVLNSDDIRTQLVGLPAEDWKPLIGVTKIELDATKSDVETSKEDKIQIDKALQANLDRLPGLQNQSKNLLEAINAAATNEARYAATQRLLAVGLTASLSPDYASRLAGVA